MLSSGCQKQIRNTIKSDTMCRALSVEQHARDACILRVLKNKWKIAYESSSASVAEICYRRSAAELQITDLDVSISRQQTVLNRMTFYTELNWVIGERQENCAATLFETSSNNLHFNIMHTRARARTHTRDFIIQFFFYQLIHSLTASYTKYDISDGRVPAAASYHVIDRLHGNSMYM
jgi:hypothetical protein